MQIVETLKTAAAALAQAGVEDSLLEAELLLRHFLGVSRSSLFLRQKEMLQSETVAKFHALLRRRCLREPLQHICGSCEFWSMDFFVSHHAMIPRPETEFLLEHVFSTLAAARCHPCHILDLCTGSGVIAAVLAKELPDAEVTAVDCSWNALAVARRNISRHGLADRVQLLCADLFSAFRTMPLFDLIVSNPPYIKAGDIPDLQPEVRDWEPHLALSGGMSGMDVVSAICTNAVSCLRPGGWLFMEIGADIGMETEKILLRTDGWEQVKVLTDLSALPRIAQGQRIVMNLSH
ncbi:peptide chain release factor N(5)-glutamine methyltransferase [Desulfobulbus sp. F4]|nr:peptide chain release factor N(5)-glutamine methyltransferase [Desulfobulbus sp. F3]MCW5201047.1 peptide chain release factor N(5)-glutamine methyltransferase [Desulfobulbus sp. F4]